MATARTFQAMLNEYLAEDLLRTEYLKRDYIMSKVQKDDKWKGGNYVVPFEGAFATSVEFGQMTADTDVAEYNYVRGGVSYYKEQWGTLKFNDKDLVEHDGKMKDSTFLKILPNQLEQFMQYMKMVASVQLGTGPHMATATVDGTAGGVLVVDKIDRFQLGQKIYLHSSAPLVAAAYVIAINVNTSAITVSATRGGGALNISAYLVADGTKVYHPGTHPLAVGSEPINQGFGSIRSALLSAANGGSAALHGQTKLSYPFLQSVNIDGSSVNATNILEKLFDGYTAVRTKAIGSADTILMSYKHLGSIMKLIETQKGGFKVTATSTNASLYGWTEIEITSVKGALKIVGIQEWADDVIAYVDWSAMKFASNGMFRKRRNPGNGNEFYEKRNQDGYVYLVDIALFGELIVTAPNRCGIMYGIPNY